jgi:alkanesulfonate monooxygenase SsuD/methylene tetrahydromethanopterin reductase-like flavin-dependent oxidoreductase (luciferase family)
MRVGIVLLPTDRWPSQRDRWRRAEAYGFDHLWTYDHLTWGPLAHLPWGATVPALVAAASVTERVPLGTWVASPNFRHPVPFARELAGLDDVSGGRAILGVGAGPATIDGTVLGGPELSPGDRAERFEEFVAVLDHVLTMPVTTHQGRFFQAAGANTLFPCVQAPRLPFVVAANGPRTMRVAARYGEGWATTGVSSRDVTDLQWWAGVAGLAERFGAVLAEAGREPASVRRMLSVDAAPTYSLVSAAHFEDVAGRAADLGFTDIVVHWPLPGEPVYDAPESILDEIAPLLPLLPTPPPHGGSGGICGGGGALAGTL